MTDAEERWEQHDRFVSALRATDAAPVTDAQRITIDPIAELLIASVIAGPPQRRFRDVPALRAWAEAQAKAIREYVRGGHQ